VVHGTYLEAYDKIKETGLNKMGRNHIHMAIGYPGSDGVISGMRGSCEVIIEINLAKAMLGEDKIAFHKSSNNVVLSEGLEDGSIPFKYFRSV
jgi:2'-phosphotransferase